MEVSGDAPPASIFARCGDKKGDLELCSGRISECAQALYIMLCGKLRLRCKRGSEYLSETFLEYIEKATRKRSGE